MVSHCALTTHLVLMISIQIYVHLFPTLTNSSIGFFELGTEEGFIPDETLFYGSTHEVDNFPGTGIDPSPYVGERAKKAIDRRIVDRTLNRGPVSVHEFCVKW